MKFALIIIVAICVSTCLFAQTFKREESETVDAFVKRVKPSNYILVHPVLETTTWGINSKAIIALYGYDDPKDSNIGYNKIAGHLYLPTASGNYRDLAFGPIEEDGGYPEIISVFFENADTDAAKELIVLCKYPQSHYDYSGDFYETFIFDNPNQKNNLTYFGKLSSKFYGCECGWRNGKTEIAKYKTALAIRTQLRKMAF